MIHSSKLKVVLYPAPIRDLLLSLAAEGLFKVKWSSVIQDEWVRNLLQNRKDLRKQSLDLTIDSMNTAFPDANVEEFEDLISSIKLPDENDRHVVACAIRCKAELIVTFNLKDFPKIALSKYDIEVQNPDKLISDLIDSNSVLVCQGFNKMLRRLKNPRKSKSDVLETLEKCGLKLGVEKIKNHC